MRQVFVKESILSAPPEAVFGFHELPEAPSSEALAAAWPSRPTALPDTEPSGPKPFTSVSSAE